MCQRDVEQPEWREAPRGPEGERISTLPSRAVSVMRDMDARVGVEAQMDIARPAPHSYRSGWGIPHALCTMRAQSFGGHYAAVCVLPAAFCPFSNAFLGFGA